jgi:hypothetical protein
MSEREKKCGRVVTLPIQMMRLVGVKRGESQCVSIAIVTEDIRCENLAQWWSGGCLLASSRAVLLCNGANVGVLVRWPGAGLQDVGE